MIYHYITPEGFDNLLIQIKDEMLTGLWFEGSRDGDKQAPFASDQGIPIPPVLCDTCRWLDIYFTGRQPDFTPDYRIDNLTSFRKEVSEMMCEIPFGKTMTYGEIASHIAKKHGIAKMSAQAVGGAVGWNPICIIIPCHRVIGTNGNLTGYGGGMHNKIALLKLESIL
jgi:methylated-DNA-[protein]-cysteine S-methyltransferase